MSRRFGLIVVDLNLPGADGWSLLERIARELPVAVLTSSSRADDRARAEALGVRATFTKPIGVAGYPAIVSGLVELHGGAR